MYYVIFGIPVAVVFAVAQIIICKKTEKKAMRLVPLFITLGIIAALCLLITDSVSGFLAQYIDWGVLALIVYLVVGAIGSVTGTATGWIIWLIKNKVGGNK